MFKEARIKLTAWYLVIIMAISIFFSLIIYRGAILELNRIENMQRLRRPANAPVVIIDPDIVRETKSRIALSLFVLNAVILGFSGISGYFLAGKTLDPIAEMVDEQKEFVANASHEFRTPLTSLKTEIEVALRDKKLTLSEAKKLLGSNLEDVERMTKLSNSLLRLNKFQNGDIPFAKVDLAWVAKRAIGKNKVKSDLKKAVVTGNEDSLIELAAILIDNAFKYSGRNPKIEVRTGGKNLEVKDGGAGISASDLPHIFDRFYRGDKSRGTDGYGLGLSIAKQIADLHGAKLTVESKIGKGSSFKLHFS